MFVSKKQKRAVLVHLSVVGCNFLSALLIIIMVLCLPRFYPLFHDIKPSRNQATYAKNNVEAIDPVPFILINLCFSPAYKYMSPGFKLASSQNIYESWVQISLITK